MPNTMAEARPLIPRELDILPLTDRSATGAWPFCTEGTRIYLLILGSTCFVAASDPPFKTSLTRLYKDFLCCQQDSTKCHDRLWCEIASGNATERKLSELFRSQSTCNAIGGALSICVWYWVIWPQIQRRLSAERRDMTTPLILSRFGVLILEVVNTIVAYGAQKNVISVTQFERLVTYAPVVSFLIGGGPATYWSYRENIVAVAVGRPSTPPGRNGPGINGNQGRVFDIEDRQTAYVVLQVFAVGAQVLSAKLVREFIKSNSSSDTAHLWCLYGGLGSYGVGVLILFLLPRIPLPSKDEPLSNEGPVSQASPKPFTAIVALVILSGIARSPLTSSVSSNFAVRYISRRLKFDTSDAVLLTNLASLITLLLVLALRFASTHIAHHPSNPEPASTQIHVTLSKISWAGAFLITAGVGTFMMAVRSSVEITQSYPYVLTAILLICAGTSYTLFTEPILAGWSAEGKKPWVFVAQQVINAVFMTLGAWLLNWGFQRETGDGQQPDGAQFRWTYLAITGVCVVAGCFLLAAVWVSSGRRSNASEERVTEGDATPVQG